MSEEEKCPVFGCGGELTIMEEYFSKLYKCDKCGVETDKPCSYYENLEK